MHFVFIKIKKRYQFMIKQFVWGVMCTYEGTHEICVLYNKKK